MAGEGVPARVRLRYRDPQNGKWRVFDTIEIDGDDDVGEGFSERLAVFALSAAIHLATLQGWLDRDGHRWRCGVVGVTNPSRSDFSMSGPGPSSIALAAASMPSVCGPEQDQIRAGPSEHGLLSLVT